MIQAHPLSLLTVGGDVKKEMATLPHVRLCWGYGNKEHLLNIREKLENIS